MDHRQYFPLDICEEFLSGVTTRAHEFFGCHKMNDGSFRFAVYAPSASRVSLVGDFCGWDRKACPMQLLEGGVWIIAIDALEKDTYKYAVTDRFGHTILKADPYAFCGEAPPNTASVIRDISGYVWQDGEYLAARNKDMRRSPMSVYEMHLGSWRKKDERHPRYRDIAERLAAYCTEMGYTHVELLPITEYPYDPSWGYQVTGYFAPTGRYGKPQDFMYFVDTLHRAGIGLIMDFVPAHFPRDEHGLAYFDGAALYERDDAVMASHPEWGTLIFDYSKPHVQSFLLSAIAHFIDSYHVDAFRIDAVSSMLYLGYGRGGRFKRNEDGSDIDRGAVSLLQKLNTLCAERGVFTIAEESSEYPGITADIKDGGLGFTFKWNMGFMHDTLDYMSLDPIYRKYHHEKMTFSMMYAFSEHYVLPYSHDEVVHGKKSMLSKMSGDYDIQFASLRALYGWQFAHPGKKHTFMGSEFGQFIEWDEKRELDWFLLDYPRHREMQRYCRSLGEMYLQHPALWENDENWEGFSWLNCDDRDRSSLAFMRSSKGEKIVCVFNFTPRSWEFTIGLPAAGKLKLLLTSDEYCFGGRGTALPENIIVQNESFLQHPFSAKLKLPPMSASYYLFKE